VLSAFLFIQRMSEVTAVNAVTQQMARESRDVADVPLDKLTSPAVPAGVEVFEISGAFFFGTVELFRETLATLSQKPKVLILRMRYVTVMDSSGVKALHDVVQRSHREGTLVLLADVHVQPLVTLTGSAVLKTLGQDKLFESLDDALGFARRHLELGQAPRGSTTPR